MPMHADQLEDNQTLSNKTKLVDTSGSKLRVRTWGCGPNKYHGRVAALAEAAREAGLKL